MVKCCNAPDVTFHNCNSNSCHFRRCDMLFPPGLGFVCCFALCSCHASHLLASCALHLHVFIKLVVVRSCPFSLCLRCHFVRPLSSLTSLRPLVCVSETYPNPNRSVVTDESGSSSNILKISSFLCWILPSLFSRPSDYDRRDEIAP